MKFDELSLDDSFDVFAHWWLPEFPENRLPGTLTYSPADRTILALQGVFDQPGLRELRYILGGEAFSADRIYGEQPDGSPLTVCGAVMTNLNETSSFECRYVLAGACVAADDGHNPVTALFSYSNLEEWSCVPFLRAQRSELPDQTTYSFPSDHKQLLSIPKGENHPELTLTGHTVGQLTPSDARFERKAYFRAAFDTSETAPILEFANEVAQLLTILMGARANLNRLQYFSADTTVHVFFQRVRAGSPRKVAPYEMAFPLPQLGDRAVIVFSEWFRSISIMRPVYSAFFSTLFNDGAFIDTKFQALTQALESFHRRTREGFYLKADEYAEVERTLVKAIPQGTPADLRSRLKNTIKYGNEFSLRKRLGRLIEELQPKTREILWVSPTFVSDVVDTRNYYTHLDDATKTSSVGNGAALYYLNQRLSALFLIHVLVSLGIPEEEARDGVIKGRRFAP